MARVAACQAGRAKILFPCFTATEKKESRRTQLHAAFCFGFCVA
jgi:hypothetical protein